MKFQLKGGLACTFKILPNFDGKELFFGVYDLVFQFGKDQLGRVRAIFFLQQCTIFTFLRFQFMGSKLPTTKAMGLAYSKCLEDIMVIECRPQ